MPAGRRKIAFRADAGVVLGGGHVMRCLTLAHAFARRGAEILFLVGPDAGSTVPALGASGFRAVTVPPDPSGVADAIMAAWRDGADLLVVDTYAMDASAHRELRRAARRLAVIDDLADRAYDCDVLIDQNLGRQEADYAGHVPGHCRIYTGPQYALLRPEFAARRPIALARRAAACEESLGIRRVLVSIGMTDPDGVTAEIVIAAREATPDATIDVVVSGHAASLPVLRRLAQQHPHVVLHVDGADMPDLMCRADLAIGAAGSTSWERCCLGLPTVLLVLADNQRFGAENLATAGAAIAVSRDGATRDAVAQAVRTLAASPEACRRMSAAASTICDGAGASRLIELLSEQGDTAHGEGDEDIALTRAAADECEMLWAWRNDEMTRAMSANSDPLPIADHRRWFERQCANTDVMLLVGRLRGIPVGTLRFERQQDEQAVVSITVAPEMRGQGVGANLLAAGCRHAREQGLASAIKALVKTDNVRSMRIFEAEGFTRAGEEDGMAVWYLDLGGAMAWTNDEGKTG